MVFFFFSSRRRHTRCLSDWSSDVCSSDLEGLLVETVEKGGPADAAGIHGGDRLVQAGLQKFYIGGDVMVAIDGQKVANQFDLNVILNHHRPGETVNVTVYRGGKKMEVPLKLGERDAK